MDRKRIWFIAFLLAMVIPSLAIQYFVSGDIYPSQVLATGLGAAIGWALISRAKRPATLWMLAAFLALFIPVIMVGLVSLAASLLAFELALPIVIVVYLLGVLMVLLGFFRYRSRFKIEQLSAGPRVDERQQYHLGESGNWSFLFLNLLIIAALVQPWIPLGQAGLWIGILMAGLVFWAASLVVLDLKR